MRFLICLAVIGCAWLYLQQDQKSSPAVVRKAATHGDFTKKLAPQMLDLQGNKATLGITAKKYTLLYFSASWCPPCQKFTPTLVSNNVRLNKLDCGVLLVSADRSRSDMLGYMKQKKMPFPGIEAQAAAEAGLQQYGERGIPSLTLVDKAGNVLIKGYADKLEEILDYLKKSRS